MLFNKELYFNTVSDLGANIEFYPSYASCSQLFFSVNSGTCKNILPKISRPEIALICINKPHASDSI